MTDNNINKLAELLEIADNTPFVDYKEEARWLLANGVILPPCKVGDVLYLPISHRVIAYKVSAIKFDGDLLKIVTHNKLSGTQRTIWSQDIGTTIFLTKEEAEEKLKELNNNA